MSKSTASNTNLRTTADCTLKTHANSQSGFGENGFSVRLRHPGLLTFPRASSLPARIPCKPYTTAHAPKSILHNLSFTLPFSLVLADQ